VAFGSPHLDSVSMAEHFGRQIVDVCAKELSHAKEKRGGSLFSALSLNKVHGNHMLPRQCA
jgi:hypothetical protein